MLFRSDLWEAVALAISAENRKIEIFVRHNVSRGIAREAMLRNLIVQHTPAPYVVRTGFVYSDNQEASPSKQCDVLVYDPSEYQPYYQLDEFVVVPSFAARVIVEVKSTIDDRQFEKILEMAAYGRSVNKPLLGFVYGGWTFDTFCKYTRQFAADMLAMPICLVVHERNYLAIRVPRNDGLVYLVIDFARSAPASPGIGTAYFMDMYNQLVRKIEPPPAAVWDWFANRLTIVPPEGKKWLSSDGVIHDLRELATSSPAT